jgi:hypothetical protein
MRNFIEKIVKISNYGLLCWYFWSIFITYFDNSISHDLKIGAEIINFLTISMLIRVITDDYRHPKFIDFSVAGILLAWYGYYTHFDALNNGYPVFLNVFYTTIDMLTILFLADSSINFIRETLFGKIMGKKIDTFHRFVRVFLVGILIFFYTKCFRLSQ